MIGASLDGVTFIRAADDSGDRVAFHVTEVGDVVSGTYSGGEIRRGFLVGTRRGDAIDLCYAELGEDRMMDTGRCQAMLERHDGQLRLILWHERSETVAMDVLVEHRGWGLPVERDDGSERATH